METSAKMTLIMSAVDKITAPIKRVTAGQSQLADSIKSTQAEINKLSSTNGDIEKYKKLKKQLRTTRTEFEQQQKAVQNLSNEVNASDKPTQKQIVALRKAEERLSKYRKTLKDSGHELKSVVSRLRDAGIKTNNLASSTQKIKDKTARYNDTLTQQKAKLQAVINQEKKLTAAQDKRAKSMQLASNTAIVGGSMTYVGQQTRQAVKDPVDIAATFEAQVSKVKALTRATSEEQQKLIGQARQLGAETVFGATEVAQAQEYLALAGFKSNEILAATPATLKLASAGGLDLARASDIASDSLTAFNMKSSEMGRMANVLAATANTSNTNVNMLGESMKMSAGIASKYGGDLEEVSAMLGIMADSGIKASQGGTAIAGMYSRLNAPTAAAKRSLEELGVEVFDLEGKSRKMPDILKDIAEATANLSDQEAAPLMNNIFGREAGITAGLAALLKASDAQDGLNKKVEYLRGLSTGDYAGDLAKEKTDNLKGTVKSYESAMESLKITGGNALIPIIKDLTQWITKVTAKFDKFAQANPNVVKWIGIFAIGIAVITSVLGPLLLAISAIVGSYATFQFALTAASVAGARFNLMTGLGTKLLSMFRLSTMRSTAALVVQKGAMLAGSVAQGVMTAAQWALNAGLLACPLVWIIGLIVALVAAVVMIYKYWEPLTEFFSGLWDSVVESFSSGWDFIKAIFKWSPIGLLIQAWSPLMNFFGGLWDGIKSAASGAIDFIYNILSALMNPLGAVMSMIDSVSSWWSDDENKEIKQTITNVNDKAKPKAGRSAIAGAALTASVAALPAAATVNQVNSEIVPTNQPNIVNTELLPANNGKNVTIQEAPITIQITASPGMDEKMLAELVRKELAKAKAQNKRAERGRLYD